MNLLEQAQTIMRGGEFLLRDWLGTGARAVPATHAQERANICLAGSNGDPCANNKPGSLAVAVAAGTIKRIGRLKNKLQMRVVGEKSLKACAVCNCDLKLKVWIPIDQLYEEMDDAEYERLPDFCWVKREIEDIAA